MVKTPMTRSRPRPAIVFSSPPSPPGHHGAHHPRHRPSPPGPHSEGIRTRAMHGNVADPVSGSHRTFVDGAGGFAARPTPHLSPPGRHRQPGHRAEGTRTRAAHRDPVSPFSAGHPIYTEGRDSFAASPSPRPSPPGCHRDFSPRPSPPSAHACHMDFPSPRPSPPSAHAERIQKRATHCCVVHPSPPGRHVDCPSPRPSPPTRPADGTRKRARHPSVIAKAMWLVVVGVALSLLAVLRLHVMMMKKWSELDQLVMRMETDGRFRANVHALANS